MFNHRYAIVAAFLLSLSCEACLISTPCCDASFLSPVEPPGWTFVTPSGQNPTVGVSDRGAHGGQYAAVLFTWDTTGIGYGLMQNVLASQFRGRRVRLSAWLRETSNTSRDNTLWVRIVSARDGRAWTSSSPTGTNPSRENVFGLSPWRRSEIVLDVPDDATAISFGVLIVGAPFDRQRGPGPHQLIVDDVRLEIVDTLTGLAGKSSAVVEDFLKQVPRVEPAAAPMNLDFEMR